MIDTKAAQQTLTEAADVLERAGHTAEAGWVRALRMHLQRDEAACIKLAPLVEAARKGAGKALDDAVAARRAAVKAEVAAEQATREAARAERKGRGP